MTGLLLPVWKHLPRGSGKVYRLQTDEGERIMGRLISAGDVPALRIAFNLDGGPALTPDGALACSFTKEIPSPFAAASRFASRRDGRQPHRADRFRQHRNRSAESLRALQRNHFLEAAAVHPRRSGNGERGHAASFHPLSASGFRVKLIAGPLPQPPHRKIIMGRAPSFRGGWPRTPRRSADIIFPMAEARAITGSRAMSGKSRQKPLRQAVRRGCGKWTDAAVGLYGDLLDLIGLNKDIGACAKRSRRRGSF